MGVILGFPRGHFRYEKKNCMAEVSRHYKIIINHKCTIINLWFFFFVIFFINLIIFFSVNLIIFILYAVLDFFFFFFFETDFLFIYYLSSLLELLRIIRTLPYFAMNEGSCICASWVRGDYMALTAPDFENWCDNISHLKIIIYILCIDSKHNNIIECNIVI